MKKELKIRRFRIEMITNLNIEKDVENEVLKRAVVDEGYEVKELK